MAGKTAGVAAAVVTAVTAHIAYFRFGSHRYRHSPVRGSGFLTPRAGGLPGQSRRLERVSDGELLIDDALLFREHFFPGQRGGRYGSNDLHRNRTGSLHIGEGHHPAGIHTAIHGCRVDRKQRC